MKIVFPTRQEVKAVARQSLEQKFPLYDESHEIHSLRRDDIIWVGYRTSDKDNSTKFDLQLWPEELYLENIELEESQRGKGLGWKLYEAVHEIAKRFECKKVTQTPDGGFFKDGVIVKSRKDYLLQRGYVEATDTEVEFFL